MSLTGRKQGPMYSLLGALFFVLALSPSPLRAASSLPQIRKELQENGRAVICVVLDDGSGPGSRTGGWRTARATPRSSPGLSATGMAAAAARAGTR